MNTWTAAAFLLFRFECNMASVSVPLYRVQNKEQYGRPNLRAVKRQHDQSDAVLSQTQHVFADRGLEFYSLVLIGTPPQALKLLFDTGSTDTWVLAAKCKEFDSILNNGCRLHKQYDSSKSTTYRSEGIHVNLSYGDGTEVYGISAFDKFTIADMTIASQGFSEVYFELDTVHSATDGIIGMAYPRLSVTGHDTPTTNLAKQGLLDLDIFSLYISVNDTGTYGGEITFGGTNTAFYTGDILYTPVVQRAFWQIEIDAIRFGGEDPVTVCRNCPAIVDTGYSFSRAPKLELTILNSRIGATSLGYTYTVSCGNVSLLPILQFVMDGHALHLTPDSYIMKAQNADGTSRCTSIFAEDSFYCTRKPCWVLGVTFLRTFYSVYDKEQHRVGFAALRDRSVWIEQLSAEALLALQNSSPACLKDLWHISVRLAIICFLILMLT